jgi:hypothetical protein
MRTFFLLLAAVAMASSASAEPMFLAKQYTRCTACHYSPTGGGLLTPYGRLLSHRELSTTGPTDVSPRSGDDEEDRRNEQAFLYGVLGDAPGSVHLGLEARPSHLRVGFPGGHQVMDLLMNFDLIGAVEKNRWMAYGSIGREPPNSAVRDGRTLPDAAFVSYEHWISFQADGGVRIRAGRFLPAYGVRFADHTSYARSPLNLEQDDQVYGLELSDTIGSSLIQITVSPGKAEAILHDRTHRGFSAAGRWQVDLTPRAAIVGSALYRHSTDVDPRSGAAGGAVGFAPSSRVTLWTEVDADLKTEPAGGVSWLVVNETSVEVYRGIWLKISPQFRTAGDVPGSSDRRRLVIATDLLPRTHWHVNVSYYRDRSSAATTATLLAQLHLYL